MSASNLLETNLLKLLFQNIGLPNVGDATGLRPSTTAGVFFIGLHTASPGEAGGETTNETTYTNYVPISAARNNTVWIVTGDTADNGVALTFATCGATGAALTHHHIGSAGNAGGDMFLYAALNATFNVSNGIAPSFDIGALDTTLD